MGRSRNVIAIPCGAVSQEDGNKRHPGHSFEGVQQNISVLGNFPLVLWFSAFLKGREDTMLFLSDLPHGVNFCSVLHRLWRGFCVVVLFLTLEFHFCEHCSREVCLHTWLEVGAEAAQFHCTNHFCKVWFFLLAHITQHSEETQASG